jgi:hypothetical protein
VPSPQGTQLAVQAATDTAHSGSGATTQYTSVPFTAAAATASPVPLPAALVYAALCTPGAL